MMRSKPAAAATQPGVSVAAETVLARGNAVDGVCAGLLAAAALDAGVLFGSVHVLVAGPGFGLRCIDGRLRQPGRGAPRPRGFITPEEVPSAARVAVPALPAAVATALSMFGSVTPRVAVAPALDLLTRDHPRRVLLGAIAREGPAALAKDQFAEPIVAAAGRFAGGQVTVDDLRAPRAPALACHVDGHAASAPFARDAEEDSTLTASDCHVVVAADRRGGIAAACYEIARDGVAIDALGVVAPLRAHPVMRGVRRTEPGATLACASTIVLVDVLGDERYDVAAGFAGDKGSVHAYQLAIALAGGATLEDALRDRAPSSAVLQTERATRAYSFTP